MIAREKGWGEKLKANVDHVSRRETGNSLLAVLMTVKILLEIVYHRVIV